MNRNRLMFFCLWMLTGISFLPAQLAIGTAADFSRTRWTEATPPEARFGEWKPGIAYNLGYWFRLPRQRVEFIPHLEYRRLAGTDTEQLRSYGAAVSINVYPFDFAGDCDCPTFGKQGPQLEKGFFVHFTPGYTRYQTRVSQEPDFAGGGLTLGGGVGLDIGLSNLLTITPLAGVHYGTAALGQEVVLADANGQETTTQPALTTLQLGLRLLFRFDHKRY